MKPIFFLTLCLFSGCVQSPPERFTVELGNPIQEEVEAPVEKPMKRDEVPYDQTWDEHLCLAHNIFFEARGEGELGMKLVAQVTLNRVRSTKSYMKNTICEVVKTKNAFAWYADGKSDRPKEGKSWELAKKIARNAINGDYKNLTNSLYFKVCDHESSFFENLRLSHKHKRHCFYISD